MDQNHFAVEIVTGLVRLSVEWLSDLKESVVNENFIENKCALFPEDIIHFGSKWLLPHFKHCLICRILVLTKVQYSFTEGKGTVTDKRRKKSNGVLVACSKRCMSFFHTLSKRGQVKPNGILLWSDIRHLSGIWETLLFFRSLSSVVYFQSTFRAQQSQPKHQRRRPSLLGC